MKLPSLRKIFRPRTPQAQQAFARFLEQYEAHVNQIDTVVLNILVWGPGLASHSAVAQKRKDIRQALLDDGHNAMYSEELPEIKRGLSLRSHEFAQALSVDLIIVLVEDAPGAHAELEGLCIHRHVASKVYVLVPDRYKDSYSGHGAYWLLDQGYGGVYWYLEDELSKCNVLTRALQRVQARREIYAADMLAIAAPTRGIRQ